MQYFERKNVVNLHIFYIHRTCNYKACPVCGRAFFNAKIRVFYG